MKGSELLSLDIRGTVQRMEVLGLCFNKFSFTKCKPNTSHLVFMGFSFPIVEMEMLGNSLVVQWLRLHAPTVRGLGSILGQGAISCMPQLRDIECHN